MKKLLLLSGILSISLISCSKESSLNNENYTQSERAKLKIDRLGPIYIINKCFEKCNDLFAHKYILAPSIIKDKERVFFKNKERVFLIQPSISMETLPKQYLWSIQKIDRKYVKIWSLKPYLSRKLTALDIDWHAKPEYALVSSESNDSGQEWELIGRGNMDQSDYYIQFLGVMVNKRTGQMLGLKDEDGWFSVVGDKIYAGSDEEKHFNQYGHFDAYKDKSHIWGIRSK